MDDPEAENAMDGMPRREPSQAAPTVPEMLTVEPRLSIMLLVTNNASCFFDVYSLPTLGPLTTMSGASPNNTGDSV